jgi:putative NIF3 family GTP cyclohydrolase 1 type 2
LVTGDLKYHDYFMAEGKILLIDAGHYETEQFTKKLIVDFLKKKIPNFAIILSDTITNPIKYY